MLRPIYVLGVAVTLVAGAKPPASLNAAPVPAAPGGQPVTQVSAPFSGSVWASCANGGSGESVQLSGALAISSHTVTDASGGIHQRSHVRPDGVTGVGASTGTKYVGTGGTLVIEYKAPDGQLAQYTMVNNFRIIGQGPDNNLMVHYTVHQSWNANGDLTASVSLHSIECK